MTTITQPDPFTTAYQLISKVSGDLDRRTPNPRHYWRRGRLLKSLDEVVLAALAGELTIGRPQ